MLTMFLILFTITYIAAMVYYFYQDAARTCDIQRIRDESQKRRPAIAAKYAQWNVQDEAQISRGMERIQSIADRCNAIGKQIDQAMARTQAVLDRYYGTPLVNTTNTTNTTNQTMTTTTTTTDMSRFSTDMVAPIINNNNDHRRIHAMTTRRSMMILRSNY
mmetsp:Transcript_10761/g.23996  ORF Transcript_10761/g.23996 Transcript_10761/m.23996 type:complete len:161 (+) Transcript_10761:459-941(+)